MQWRQHMKSIGVMSTAALFLLFGMAAPANGRQEKPKEEAKPQNQEQQAKPAKQEEAKAPKQQQEAKPPKQEQAKPEKQQQAKAPKQQQAKPEQQQAKAPKQEQHAAPEKQQQQAKQQPQQKNNSAKQQPAHQQQASYSHAPQRTQQAIATQRAQPALRLSARGSGRIPDDRFRANFGSGHNFHMGNPVLVGGYSRFQYGGFWFGFVQPWPSGWYYTDDVYIDYVDGGYYMYNPYYPGTRFSISVVI
jgi:primosomal protein N'